MDDTNATTPADRGADELSGFLADLQTHCLTPTWIYARDFTPVVPPVSYAPYLWKWEMFREKLERAQRLIPIEKGGDRRSMEVVNPALKAHHATTHTIGAALQIVKPGECPPPHRHAAAAIRFFLEGEGAYTTVDGEKLLMFRGDLVLTPSGCWHEHGNEGTEPVIWLDALDYPLANLLQQGYFEGSAADHRQLEYQIGHTARRVGLTRPAWERRDATVPRVTYRWAETAASLEALRGESCSPYDGVYLEYVNPYNEGPVLPTMSCFIQLLRPGEHTAAHRETTSTVYFVFEGGGHSVIGGEKFEWSKGDFFLVPPWAYHEHANGPNTDSILFSVSDKAVLDAFGLYREEPLPGGERHQPVERQFTPTL